MRGWARYPCNRDLSLFPRRDSSWKLKLRAFVSKRRTNTRYIAQNVEDTYNCAVFFVFESRCFAKTRRGWRKRQDTVGRANLFFLFRSIIISAPFFLPRPFKLIAHAVVTIHGNVSRGKRRKRPIRGTIRTVRFGCTNIRNPIVSDRLLADLTAFPIVVFEFVSH